MTKRIEFLSIWISGFKSFSGKAQELRMDARPIGVHYVRGENRLQPRLGSNGSGKTSLWDALNWCLWAQTASGLRNNDVRPWDGAKKKTHVAVTVSVNDKTHMIERETGPNRLVIDEREVGQEAVAELLGMDFKLFNQVVLYGQGRPLFFDLQPKDKLALFSEVLRLDRWDELSQVASQRVSELERKDAELQGRKAGHERALADLADLIEAATEKLDSWEDNLAKTMRECEAAMKKAKPLLESSREALGKAELAQDSAGTELKSVEKSLDTFRDERLVVQRAIDKFETECKAKQREVTRLKNELAELKAGGICPTCGQPVKKADTAAHQKELKQRIAELQDEADAPVPKKLRNALAENDRQLAEYRELRDKLRTRLESADSAVNLYRPQVIELSGRIEQLKKTIEEQENATNPHGEQIREFKKKKKELERELTEFDDLASKTMARCDRARFWVKGFKDVRLFIIEEVLHDLQLVTDAMLADVGLGDWQINYAVERESKSGSVQRGLNVTILSPQNENPVKWESWSGGESQRLRLVGALALSEVLLNYAGVETNLEILDEPTRHLSTEGVRDVCAFLAQRAEQLKKHIWYVDHQSVESNHFSSVLTVSKTEKGSQLDAPPEGQERVKRVERTLSRVKRVKR